MIAVMAKSLVRSAAVVMALGLAACGGGDDGTAAPVAGTDTTVTALDGTHVYFTGAENHRVVDVPVTFPAAGLRYTKITLRLGVRCPMPGGCDSWDRLGHLAILQPATTGADPVELEVARFVTPYK